ncbi:MAG: phosphoesterase PA-phosphatase related protein [Phycisphaerales bacterium]|nr:phosphoesterase PA-phosphatase related protein [Phycisphaerales bacterium]
MNTPRRFSSFLVVTWLLALAVAFSIDRAVAEWVKTAVPIDKRQHLTKLVIETIKLPGWGWFTLGVAILLGLFHRRRWYGAAGLALSAVAVGVTYGLIKWTAGRHRPVKGIAPFVFKPFPGGLTGLFKEEALCFPSGHALLSFATAASLAVLLPRWRWAFFAVAAAVGAERVLENAHYVSDVVAGAGMGTLLGWLITRTVLAIQKANGDGAPGSPPANEHTSDSLTQ